MAPRISGCSEYFVLKVRQLLLIIQMADQPLATVRLNKLGLVLVFIGYVLETVRIVFEKKASDLAGRYELRRAHHGR
jgi:TctA family transporter